MKNNNSIWISIEYKNYYSDCEKQGLQLHFLDMKISEELRLICIRFCKWLRKKYWFPIRCKLCFEYYPYYRSGETRNNANAVFYFPKYNNSEEMIEYPSIRVAVSEYEKLVKKDNKEDILFHYLCLITHELTHYFQWYFFETEKQSKRKLEIEANKWAHSLVSTYMNQM